MAAFLVYATKSLISYIKVLVFVNKSSFIIEKICPWILIGTYDTPPYCTNDDELMAR